MGCSGAAEDKEYWAVSEIGKLSTTPPDLDHPGTLLPGYARIHYYRPGGNFTNWTIYSLGDTAEPAENFNEGPTFPTGYDAYGSFYDIRLKPNPQDLGFIVHNVSTGTKNNVAIQSTYSQSDWNYALVYSPTASLQITSAGTLTGGFTQAEATQYPQLAGYAVFHLPGTVQMETLQQMLQGQIVLTATDSTGVLRYLTGVQDAGALNDLFFTRARWDQCSPMMVQPSMFGRRRRSR